MWDFRRAIVVNGKSVPTCPMFAKVVDPHELSGGIEYIDANFFLNVDVVHFSSACQPVWLCGPRGLFAAPDQLLWRVHAKEIPLLQEIMHMIKTGNASMKSKQHENLIVVKVRGKIFLVANTPRSVSLALTCTPEAVPGSFEDKISMLGWFLAELDKDLKALKENLALQENIAQGETGDAKSSCCDGHGDGTALAIKEGLEVLNASPKVSHATWAPSKKSFRIVTKSNSIQQFRARTTWPQTRKRKADDMTLSRAVCSATANALRWVERGD